MVGSIGYIGETERERQNRELAESIAEDMRVAAAEEEARQKAIAAGEAFRYAIEEAQAREAAAAADRAARAAREAELWAARGSDTAVAGPSDVRSLLLKLAAQGQRSVSQDPGWMSSGGAGASSGGAGASSGGAGASSRGAGASSGAYERMTAPTDDPRERPLLKYGLLAIGVVAAILVVVPRVMRNPHRRRRRG